MRLQLSLTCALTLELSDGEAVRLERTVRPAKARLLNRYLRTERLKGMQQSACRLNIDQL